MRGRGGKLLEVVGREHDRELRLLARRAPLSAANSVSRPGRSSPEPGSSSRRSGGRGTSARAMSVRVRSPCEQFRNGRPARASSENVRKQAPHPCPGGRVHPVGKPADGAGRAGLDDLRPPSARSANREARRASTNPIRSRSLATSVRPSVSPRIVTRPALGNSTAAATVSSVVLPAPFGPSSAQVSPGATCQSTSSMIGLRVPWPRASARSRRLPGRASAPSRRRYLGARAACDDQSQAGPRPTAA